MDASNTPDVDVVKDAERILYREKLRVCEERAAQRLPHTSSVRWTHLFRHSPVIQVVVVDGVVVGRIRRSGRRCHQERSAGVIRIAMTLAGLGPPADIAAGDPDKGHAASGQRLRNLAARSVETLMTPRE